LPSSEICRINRLLLDKITSTANVSEEWSYPGICSDPMVAIQAISAGKQRLGSTLELEVNKMHHVIRYSRQIRFSGTISLLIAILTLGGCAGSYGHLQPSSAVTAIFKSDKILPNHKYYYTGPDGWPDAIIAVDEHYTLVSDQWTAFEPSAKRLKHLMEFAQSHYGTNAHHFPYGYTILTPDGRKVGVWYSIWDLTTIEMRSDHEVDIYPPLTKDLMNDGDKDHDHDRDTP
jgi:hypothetical protein